MERKEKASMLPWMPFGLTCFSRTCLCPSARLAFGSRLCCSVMPPCIYGPWHRTCGCTSRADDRGVRIYDCTCHTCVRICFGHTDTCGPCGHTYERICRADDRGVRICDCTCRTCVRICFGHTGTCGPCGHTCDRTCPACGRACDTYGRTCRNG